MQSLSTLNWLAVLQLLGLWLLVVFVALRVLDVLFPRLRRGDDDAAPSRLGPPARRLNMPR
ncbi:MAG TPA: hypothetical protein VFX76_13730, partial [Roseiflexaceae bacterium]|nr:hypothetical protein [Roseiflexaceae bacterium]